MGCVSGRKNEVKIISRVKTRKKTVNSDVQTEPDSHAKTSSSSSRKNPFISFVRAMSNKIEDNYRILEKIGSGGFGEIYKAEHIKSGFIRAMKIIKKLSTESSDKEDDINFKSEITILMEIDHPNIIKIFEYYSDDFAYYIITEYVSGCELYNFILKAKKFSEKQTAMILYQILSALNYLHSKDIVHRDIKPENILITTDLNIKLIDFGMSVKVENKKLNDVVGTSYYMAPEVIRGEYGPKCDIWSCGIIFHILLIGYPPFQGRNRIEIFEKILKGKLSTQIDRQEWQRITPLAKDLLLKMLTYEPELRVSAEEAIRHPWIIGSHAREQELCEEIALDALANIRNFSAREKLRVATMAYIVHFVYATKDVSDLQKMFKIFDKNSDGKLSLNEFTLGYTNYYGKVLTDFEMKNIFEELDQNGDGFIEYQEFLRATINQKQMLAENNLFMAFEQFDENGDKKLSFDEIKLLLTGEDSESIRILIQKYDVDDDNCLSFTEFVRLMNEIIEM